MHRRPGRAERSYRNTVYCAASLQQRGAQLTGRYCSNRWCAVCNRVRTARAIDRYTAPLSAWGSRWFVTLTAPNVAGAQLDAEVDRYLADFTAAKRAIKRTDGIRFVALRKLECTYNPRRGDYHPHFHVVVDGEAAARALVARWLELRPDATAAAQDARRCGDGDLRELFKYFTKLVTRSDATEDRPGKRVADVAALDTIFQAMRGHRVYQPVGFRLTTPNEAAADEEASVGEDGHTAAPAGVSGALWEWSQGAHDWVNPDTGECLTGYDPSDAMRQLVEDLGARLTTPNESPRAHPPPAPIATAPPAVKPAA